MADFNHDGRTDLVVAQNSGATKLYANQRAKKGLRVSLQGSAGNADSVGAQMRLIYEAGRFGPCRTIHAGSGYWSQDAATQVLGFSSVPESLWIRWPGGNEQTVKLTPNIWEVRVDAARGPK